MAFPLHCAAAGQCVRACFWQPLEKERINRMLALALNTERLKEMQLNASSLLSEVRSRWAQT